MKTRHLNGKRKEERLKSLLKKRKEVINKKENGILPKTDEVN